MAFFKNSKQQLDNWETAQAKEVQDSNYKNTLQIDYGYQPSSLQSRGLNLPLHRRMHCCSSYYFGTHRPQVLSIFCMRAPICRAARRQRTGCSQGSLGPGSW